LKQVYKITFERPYFKFEYPKKPFTKNKKHRTVYSIIQAKDKQQAIRILINNNGIVKIKEVKFLGDQKKGIFEAEMKIYQNRKRKKEFLHLFLKSKYFF